jgi:secondary thiamine-phosphate synthase enzyme
MFQEEFEIETRGRGSYEFTARVGAAVREAGAASGLCHIFLAHTSASLMLCENADPVVRSDLETFMTDLVPDGDPRFRHAAEGPDDMPAHVRSVLTHADLTIPIVSGRLALGTWQGIYLWEHRFQPQRRRVIVTVSEQQALSGARAP